MLDEEAGLKSYETDRQWFLEIQHIAKQKVALLQLVDDENHPGNVDLVLDCLRSIYCVDSCDTAGVFLEILRQTLAMMAGSRADQIEEHTLYAIIDAQMKAYAIEDPNLRNQALASLMLPPPDSPPVDDRLVRKRIIEWRKPQGPC